MTRTTQLSWKVYAVAVPVFNGALGAFVYALGTLLQWEFSR
jgi:hypothetical protein